MSELRCLKNSVDCFPNLIFNWFHFAHIQLLNPRRRLLLSSSPSFQFSELQENLSHVSWYGRAYIFEKPPVTLPAAVPITPRAGSETRPVCGCDGTEPPSAPLPESLVLWNDSSAGMDPSQVSYFQSVAPGNTLFNTPELLLKGPSVPRPGQVVIVSKLSGLFIHRCSGWVNGLASKSCAFTFFFFFFGPHSPDVTSKMWTVSHNNNNHNNQLPDRLTFAL